MPEVARFYGLVIRMFFREHGPPHFHVEYAEHRAIVAIENLAVLQGELPARALGLVIEWASLHREELAQCWHRARRHEAPGKIAPLQ